MCIFLFVSEHVTVYYPYNTNVSNLATNQHELLHISVSLHSNAVTSKIKLDAKKCLYLGNGLVIGEGL